MKRQRIIFVPQYPTPMRYQEWWWNKLPEEFSKAGFDVLILGAAAAAMLKEASDHSMFSPIDAAIELECSQIEQYMNAVTLKDDDILFLADLSFPGLFANVLFHKKPKKCYAFCHATSRNILDYFEKWRPEKFPIETAHSQLFDKVFVGSKYHKDKLEWKNAVVTYLPYPPIFEDLKDIKIPKRVDILSASRDNPQKVDKKLEDEVEEIFGKIQRTISGSWFSYQWILSSSKVLLITSFEETFGYQIVDAVMNGCIPLAPKRCSYPELLPRDYLYNDKYELMHKLDHFINTGVEIPTLLCDEKMKDFYDNIIEIMRGSGDHPF